MNLAISILTVLMSGVMSGIVTFRLNTRHQHRTFLRERLEECWIATDDLDTSFTMHYIRHLALFRGEITPDQLTKAVIEANPPTAGPMSYQRLEMVIAMYFNSLQPMFDQMLQTRTSLNKVISTFRCQYEGGDSDGRHLIPAFNEIMDQLSQQTTEFRAALAEEARRIA